jgi:hypothetical protein
VDIFISDSTIYSAEKDLRTIAHALSGQYSAISVRALMHSEMREQSFEEILGVTAALEDRRTHDRLKLMKTIHISCPGLTDETATVVDISREGLYITVLSRHYRVGMEIRVTIPSLEFEAFCKVVRIEELPSGYLGIGSLVLGW